ncbi:GNAT family N-acetyltransferase [Fusobacterium polymorphum]|uniref:GNAT family N-acetyltransferase n=1 Tax=Fusobacterium nucleatum subsp. polymorphum TaxID=76857 RepID=UPI00300A0E50
MWIEGIYVRTEYRRKGIAQKLLNEAINKAKLLNAQSMELMIWNFNETSKKFFENYFKIRSLILKKEL